MRWQIVDKDWNRVIECHSTRANAYRALRDVKYFNPERRLVVRDERVA